MNLAQLRIDSHAMYHTMEVNAEEGKVVQGDKDSTLEVRAGVF